MHVALATKRSALKSANDSELIAQEIVQRGAINALETLLQCGVTRENAQAMLLSLRENLAYIEALRASPNPQAEKDGPPAALAVTTGSASELEVLRDREWPWDEAMAMRMAYELHRSIGCNIGHYRNPTAAGILAVIRDAMKRVHETPNPRDERRRP